MRNRVVVFLTVALVVVGTLGGYYVGSTTKGGTVSSLSPCSNSVSPRTFYELSNSTWMTNVFQMTPGSTATVCIAYSFNRQGTFTPATVPLACGPYRAENRSIVWNCPGQITVTTSTHPFDHPSGLNIAIVYTLQAPRNDNGVYWFWIDCGEVLPIAVGPLPHSLVFPITPGCVYEPNAPSSGTVVGVSNMGVVMVLVG
jgi:hypothetical protein